MEHSSDNSKQLLDEIFVISGIIKVSVTECYQPRPSARLITFTETLIINLIIVLLHIVLKKVTTNTSTQGT